MHWSDFALLSLEEIITYYEFEVSLALANRIETEIFEQIDRIESFPLAAPESDVFPGTRKLVILNLPYVAFIRQRTDKQWEVVDIVHSARKLPKSS